MGSAQTNFNLGVSAQVSGTPELGKLASEIEKNTAALSRLADGADKVAKHPGFGSLGDKIRTGIQNPASFAASELEGMAGKLGSAGVAVASFAGGAAAAGVAIYGLAKDFGAWGTQVQNLEIRTGMTAQQISYLMYATRAAGVDIGVAEKLMRGLTQAIEDTSPKGERARVTLRGFGVDISAVRAGTASTYDVLQQISQGLNTMPTVWERNAAALQLVGKSAIEAVPFLLQFANSSKVASEAGLAISEGDVRLAKQYADQIALIESKFALFKAAAARDVLVTIKMVGDGAEWLLNLVGLRDVGKDLDLDKAALLQADIRAANQAKGKWGTVALTGIPELQRQRMLTLQDLNPEVAATPDLASPTTRAKLAQAAAIQKQIEDLQARAADAIKAEQKRQRDIIDASIASLADSSLEGRLKQVQEKMAASKPEIGKSAQADVDAYRVLREQEAVLQRQVKAARELATLKEHILTLDKRAQEAIAQAPSLVTWSMGGGEPPISEYPKGPMADDHGRIAKLQAEEYSELAKAGSNSELYSKIAKDFDALIAAEEANLQRHTQEWAASVREMGINAPVLDLKQITKANADQYKAQFGDWFAENSGQLQDFASLHTTFQYISPQEELRNARDNEQRGLSLYAGTSQLDGTSQLAQISGQHALRQQYANDEYAALWRLADLKQTQQEKDVANEEAENQLHQKLFDADTERAQALIQLANQQKASFQNFAVGGFRAILDGSRSKEGAGASIEKFIESNLLGLADKVVSNASGMAWKTVGNLIPHAKEGTMFGKLLEGTPFGATVDPARAATELNTLETRLNTGAIQRLTAFMGSGTADAGHFGMYGSSAASPDDSTSPGGDFVIPETPLTLPANYGPMPGFGALGLGDKLFEGLDKALGQLAELPSMHGFTLPQRPGNLASPYGAPSNPGDSGGNNGGSGFFAKLLKSLPGNALETSDPAKVATEANTLQTRLNTAAIDRLTGALGGGFDSGKPFGMYGNGFGTGGGVDFLGAAIGGGPLQGGDFTIPETDVTLPANYGPFPSFSNFAGGGGGGDYVIPGSDTTLPADYGPMPGYTSISAGSSGKAPTPAQYGAAAFGAALSAYQFVTSSSDKSKLNSAGGGLESIGSVLPPPAGPIVMAVGMAAQIASMFLGDPHQQRITQETNEAMAARYTGPTPTNFMVDRSGQSVSQDIGGNFRSAQAQPLQVQVNVYTMDAKSFNDNADMIVGALATGLESNLGQSVRLTAALRNVVTPG